jgi:hypothetical protein
LCRGWEMERSASFSAESGPFPRAATVVQQKGSVILIGIDVAGACGKFRPSEQPGPEQGRSRRGTAGVESAEWINTSRSESDSRADRIRFDVTSCPQLARTGEGATPPTTRSMQNAPAIHWFARLRNEESIATRTGEGTTI